MAEQDTLRKQIADFGEEQTKITVRDLRYVELHKHNF